MLLVFTRGEMLGFSKYHTIIGETLMLLEISAILGALKAVNQGISVVKESNKNLGDIASFFSQHSEAKESVANIEKEAATGNRRLTREEALDIAWAKKALREQEKEFKKSIPRDVWNDMLFIQSKSIAEEKHADLQAVLNERKKVAQLKSRATSAVSTLICMVVIAVALGYFTGNL
tara:strand:- start:8582 stop:9109 length:528 start_codon:yes stop_codon:yes gene_type:complete